MIHKSVMLNLLKNNIKVTKMHADQEVSLQANLKSHRGKTREQQQCKLNFQPEQT